MTQPTIAIATLTAAGASPKATSPSHPVPVTIAPTPSSTTLDNWTPAEGSKTVAATGTPEALAASGTCREVFIYPLRTNTGVVYWGTVSTNDAQHGTLPIVLTAPQGKLINLASIYLDVTVNGEGVRYIATN